MNKLLIGLLVAAAGVGIFFLTRKKNASPVATEFKKEWILGKWTSTTKDSVPVQYQFEFQDKGRLIRSAGDSVKADTAYYEWNKSNDLVWKQKSTDSVGKDLTVLKLTVDSLEVRDKDSVVNLFTKLK